MGHVLGCTTRDGEAAVLKLNPPSADAFAGPPEHEAAALRAWAGRGAVELLAFAPDLRALLTRRASPGTPLADGAEAQARREVAYVLTQLFDARIPDADLMRLAEAADLHLIAKLAESDGAVPEQLVRRARSVAARLASSAPEEVLLHGDLMDKNLLRDGERLVAIDPMPHVGDPCSDIGFWSATRSPSRDIDERAAELARMLGLEAERARRWAAVYAVGSACEAWRSDTGPLRAWVKSADAAALLDG